MESFQRLSLSNFKKCKKCDTLKSFDCFYKQKNSGDKNGLAYSCKTCIEKRRKERKISRKCTTCKEIFLNSKFYYNPETKFYGKICEDCRSKQKCFICKKVLPISEFNSDVSRSRKVSGNCKKCGSEILNKRDDRKREVRAKYEKHKRDTDPLYKLKQKCYIRIYHYVKDQVKSERTEEVLGIKKYGFNFFKKWLEFQFEDGMNFDNYGRGNDTWQQDHLIPLSYYDFTVKSNIFKAYHWSNVRPMWSNKNNEKKDSIPDTKTIITQLCKSIIFEITENL